jgi:hypothetical protein
MQKMRAVVFGAVSIFPALFIGMMVYVLLGGETEFPEWEIWMYGPCYLLPSLIVVGSFLIGLSEQEDAQ